MDKPSFSVDDPEKALARFQQAMQRILSVSKEELKRREEEAKRERQAKRRKSR
jgi:hypothetical protein